MHKVNNQEKPRIYNNLIKKLVHKYSTNFSKSNFCFKYVSLNITNNSVFFPWSKTVEGFRPSRRKDLEFYSLFKKIKKKNDQNYL